MKKLIIIILAALLCLPVFSYAAGSVTQTYAIVDRNSGLSTLTFAWTGDSSDGSVPATATSTANSAAIAGKYVVMVVTNPGSTAPTAAYDITITDSDGVDIMGGTLADRSATLTEQVVPYVGAAYSPRPIDANGITLTITNNSVNSATGTVVLYLSR